MLVLGICLLVWSCSTSKFDFNTAYKFSKIDRRVTPTLQSVNPVASLKPTASTNETIPSDASLKTMVTEKLPTISEQYKSASKSEKKAIRKQVKEEFKLLRQEVKKAKKEAAAKDVVFNKKMYIGVIILGAGILVAILASGPVGAVGIIVGIGLVAWGFIEQA